VARDADFNETRENLHAFEIEDQTRRARRNTTSLSCKIWPLILNPIYCLESCQMASKGSSPNTDDNPSSRPFKAQTQKLKEFFSIPPPIKKLFDNFPVITYQANDLPLRAPKLERLPMLYVFSTSENARAGKPSFNPSCLKWQVSASHPQLWR
jgi:hypothetical protein